MNRVLSCLLGAFFLLFATQAQAQATRTWVSGVGDDANPCSRTAPCKTFAGAISKTATGGEINVLDPGGFGAITITKSITIDGLGPMASILASNVNGVIINGAGISVTLRNLTINGANTSIGNGIRIINAANVTIDNVVIENFGGQTTNGRGVAIETSANIRVAIINSRFDHNNFISIHSNPTAGSVDLFVDNVEITNGGSTGIQLRQNTGAIINDTSVTNARTAAGLTLELTTTAANVSNSNFSQNSFGIFNGNGGGAPTVRLFGSVITGNATDGLRVNGGSVISLGNNMIQGNAGNQTPTSTIGTQ